MTNITTLEMATMESGIPIPLNNPLGPYNIKVFWMVSMALEYLEVILVMLVASSIVPPYWCWVTTRICKFESPFWVHFLCIFFSLEMVFVVR